MSTADNMLSRTQVLIVTVLPCRTKFLSDDWMEQSGFIEPVLEGISSKFWWDTIQADFIYVGFDQPKC